MDKLMAGCQRGNKALFEPILTRFSDTNMRQINTLRPGGYFTNDVSHALQNIPSKFVYCRNRTSYENFKLTLYIHVPKAHTKFQLEILIINVSSDIVYIRKIIFGELTKL